MGGILTQRNKMFVQEYIKAEGNGAEAWRRIYPKGDMKLAKNQASRALARPHVKAYYNRLLERHMKKSEITIEKILSDYQYALDLAKEQNKAGDIVLAANSQAKLVGLLRDRMEHGGVGEFDGADAAEVLEIVAQQAGPEAALALSAAFGLSKQAEEVLEQAEQLLEAAPPTDAVN